MSYGIIFWGNSWHSSIIFKLQKKVIRIMEGCGNRASCISLFKKFQILPLKSQYMLPSLMFVVQNKTLFLTNTENYNLDSFIIHRYSALGPVWAETRAQSGDGYSSGTMHPGQVLRGRLPFGNQKKKKICTTLKQT
jgi:hypothetical protein